MNRRRFLSIAAVALASPARAAAPQEWTGTALGAEVRIVLADATPAVSARVFSRIQNALRHVESQFSLHRDSELVRLNRIGRLAHPPPQMLEVFEISGEVHDATNGLFDPSIQPLWLATAEGGDVTAARQSVGWQGVRISPGEIALDPGMQLTFNGIAQGHAADRVADLLGREGFGDVLIDTGEIVGLGHHPAGGAWRAAIALPDGKIVGRAELSGRALATSSPRGTLIGKGVPHIINPHGVPAHWQLASVSAPRAAIADALSTAFCLMERADIDAALAKFPGARLEALV